MTEKLTMKKLSNELEQLRTQMQELEARLESRVERKLESALAAAKSVTQPASTTESLTGIDAAQRQRLITNEAYLIAERRGFKEGDPKQDWAEAEKLVDYKIMLASAPTPSATRAAKTLKKTTRSAKKPNISTKAGVNTSATLKS